MISVVVTSCHRPENVNRICANLFKYQMVNDIIVWHSNPQNRHLLNVGQFAKVSVVETSDDFGLNVRFLAGMLAKNNHILFQDDDVIVPQETVERLLTESGEYGKLVGVIGRNFNWSNLTYSAKTYFGEVDLVLTTCCMIGYDYLFQIAAQAFKYAKQRPTFNFDDMFMSLGYRKQSGEKPKAFQLPITRLPQHSALSHRSTHYEERTNFLREILPCY